MSPFLAVSVLTVFAKGKVLLDQDRYDEAFDALTELLEDANDNKHRLVQSPKEQE